MSRPSNELMDAVSFSPDSLRLIRRWSRDGVPTSARTLSSSSLGCAVVRRVTDDRGRSWRVRQLPSAGGHTLLFQCEVPGPRAEVRASGSPLDLLDDDALLDELMTITD